jgi:hypothetical protein
MSQGHAERRRRARPVGSPPARSAPPLHEAPVTREAFTAGFDRCFGPVYVYVSRRVSDRPTCERIVRQLLAANLGLLVGRGDESQSSSQLEAAADRLIEAESASSPSGARSSPSDSSTSPATKSEGTGDTECRSSRATG